MSKDKPEHTAIEKYSEEIKWLTENDVYEGTESADFDVLELAVILRDHAKLCVKKANEKQREKCVSAYLMVHGNDIEEHIAAIENAPSPE